MVTRLIVKGSNLYDQLGDKVILRGVNMGRMIDTPQGDWITKTFYIQWVTYDTNTISDNMKGVKDWGCNCVRLLCTAEWWLNDSDNFRSKIAEICDIANRYGIYIAFNFWRVSGDETMDFPYPPYNQFEASNLLISSKQDFVDLCVDVAEYLKDKPNVIFDLWNEPALSESPGGPGELSDWMSTCETIVNTIRNLGIETIIAIEWNTTIADKWQQPSRWGIDWIIDNHYRFEGKNI